MLIYNTALNYKLLPFPRICVSADINSSPENPVFVEMPKFSKGNFSFVGGNVANGSTTHIPITAGAYDLHIVHTNPVPTTEEYISICNSDGAEIIKLYFTSPSLHLKDIINETNWVQDFSPEIIIKPNGNSLEWWAMYPSA